MANHSKWTNSLDQSELQVQQVPSAGNHETGSKGGKKVTGAKDGKTCACLVNIDTSFIVIGQNISYGFFINQLRTLSWDNHTEKNSHLLMTDDVSTKKDFSCKINSLCA